MKLKAFAKLAINGIIRDFYMVVFSFVIFPLVLSGIYAYFQKEMFNPNNEMNKIAIAIKDVDKSNTSKALNKFLISKEIKKFIEIDKEKAKFEIVIPKGYEEKILELKDSNIIINKKDDASTTSSKIIASLIDKYNEEITNQIYIKNKISDMEISTSKKEKLISEVNKKIYAEYSTNAIKNNIIKEDKGLTSYQYYSISIFSLMFIIMIMSLTQSYYTDKETGVFKRIISASISKTQYFNYSLVNFFIYALFANVLYIAVYRVAGLSFQGSILLISLIVIAKSILECCTAGVVMAFFKEKKHAILFLNVFLILGSMIGGVFAPMDKVANGALAKISSCMPNTVIINVFKNYVLYNSFNSIKYYLLLFSVLSVAFYIIALIKVKVRWEAQ